jgi:hypothetical protein
LGTTSAEVFIVCISFIVLFSSLVLIICSVIISLFCFYNLGFLLIIDKLIIKCDESAIDRYVTAGDKSRLI